MKNEKETYLDGTDHTFAFSHGSTGRSGRQRVPRGKSWGMRGSLLSELNLTEEQEGKMTALRDSQRKDMAPIRTEMLRKRAELQLLWLEDKPDGEKIKAKQKEMRETKGRIQDKMTDFRLAVHSILTPEQRSRFMASRFNKMRGFGRGMGGPESHGMGRPPR